MPCRAFELTNIRSGDRTTFTKVKTFLEQNPDQGVRFRPDRELERARDSGQCLVVTDEGDVKGVSLIYQFDDPSSRQLYSEIGTMRIISNGFGLQDFLTRFHLFQIRLEHFEKGMPSVFAVVLPDTSSAHNLQKKVGMSKWTPSEDLNRMREEAGVPFSAAKDVLLASTQNFSNALRDLRKLHFDCNSFRTPKNDGSITVNIGWFSPELLKIDL